MATPKADYASESRVIEMPALALVRMRGTTETFADEDGTFGLDSGHLFDLRLPNFQRGLKWDKDRIKEFQDSLMQGWPIGVIVIAVESVEVINQQTGQRKYSLSLIDGQQRSWALTRLIRDFWSKPWFMFRNPKWDSIEPAAGAIEGSRVALELLSATATVPADDLKGIIEGISIAHGMAPFEDYPEFVKLVEAQLELDAGALTGDARTASRLLCDSLVDQYRALCAVNVPTLFLGESLREQLPSVFRRLNEGVPLKGYDLLAAMWQATRLARPDGSLEHESILESIRQIADKRIEESYERIEAGYTLDPNLEPLQVSELSLFDLLYYLGRKMGEPSCFRLTQDVFAFQVAALAFRGSIGRVDEGLRRAFPKDEHGYPDLGYLPRSFLRTSSEIRNALKPLMDVSSSNVTLRGEVGLTMAVVYAAAILTHETIVAPSGDRLELRARTGSAAERMVRPGVSKSAMERLHLLKHYLPLWYLHDSLKAPFSGNRAYEAASQRIWRDFRTGAGIPYVLEPAYTMFAPPPLDGLVEGLNALWDQECDAKTPMRRRISRLGAVLLRSAYCHLAVHDKVFDHVMPLEKGRAASRALGADLPLNHVANQMPLEALVNNSRGDTPWDQHRASLDQPTQQAVASVLLVPWESTAEANLASREAFMDFLRLRYRALAAQALTNLGHDEWTALDDDGQGQVLARVAPVSVPDAPEAQG